MVDADRLLASVYDDGDPDCDHVRTYTPTRPDAKSTLEVWRCDRCSFHAERRSHWFVAVCRDCSGLQLQLNADAGAEVSAADVARAFIMPFSTPAERGAWCTAHTAGTGHDNWLIVDQPAVAPPPDAASPPRIAAQP